MGYVRLYIESVDERERIGRVVRESEDTPFYGLCEALDCGYIVSRGDSEDICKYELHDCEKDCVSEVCDLSYLWKAKDKHVQELISMLAHILADRFINTDTPTEELTFTIQT